MELEEPTSQDLPPPAGENQPVIVGIGASAGGLAALKDLFDHVPEDSGLVFVVVVHLSPEHESHLADLLQPHIKMPVEQVNETVPLAANHVYVIPPGRNLSAIDTHLRVTKLEELRRERAPIDHFFRTLARTHDGHAVGVVLTGTGSDGTLGVKEIKAKGGFVIVQDPGEAQFDGMPQSAIATGVVDIVLPVARIAASVMRYAQTRPRLPKIEDEQQVDGEERALLHKIFAQLRTRGGRDFSRYKQSTIMRRIGRRMQIGSIETLPDYIQRLRDQPEEVRHLADDLLINVTSFFRDPAVFARLATDVIPKLFEGKKSDSKVRVWSVGCSTGEEAYSLAMLLLEHAGRIDAHPHIQVFASDLHEHSLARAREGLYPGDIEADVSSERLQRFFQQENGGYRVRKEVRELVLFAPHNLLADPPFSRLDLVCCRNLLIYLQRDVQRDIVELFHYSLKADGFLVLGISELVESSDLFRVEDKKRRVYRKRNLPSLEPRLPVFPMTHGRHGGETKERPQSADSTSRGAVHHTLVELFAPPSLLVGPDDQVAHFSEHVGRYLVHPGGEPTLSVFRLVRQELAVEMRAGLHAVRGSGDAVRVGPISVRFNGTSRPVSLSLRRAAEPAFEDYVLVMFDESAPLEENPSPGEGEAATSAARGGPRVEELHRELDLSRQRMQALVEEYDTSREEIRASNEELQSLNEELRSTMEELETSKEELQSMNEELQTLNQENRHKVEELAQLTSDLQNLLASTDIATLFLDRDLRIMRFTPKVSDLFNVRVTDRGRPIFDLTHRLGYDELQADANEVLKRLVPLDRELRDEGGRWYLTRLLPYRSTSDRIEGVVITFVDISERKKAEEIVRSSEERLQRMIDVDVVGVLAFDESGTILSANGAFGKMFGYDPEEIAARRLTRRMLTPPEHAEETERQLAKLVSGGRIGPYEKEYLRNDGSRTWMVFAGAGLGDGTVIEYCIGIDERKRIEKALRASEQRLGDELQAMERLHELVNRLTVSSDVTAAMTEVLDATIEVTGASMGNVQLFDPTGRKLRIVAQSGFDEEFVDHFRGVAEDGHCACGRAIASKKRVIVEDIWEDPLYRPHREVAAKAGYRGVQSTPLLSRSGEVLGLLSTHYAEPYRSEEHDLKRLDLHARQAADFIDRFRGGQALQESEERYRLLVESAREYAIVMLDLEGRIHTWNTGAERVFGFTEAEAAGLPGAVIFTEEDRAAGVPGKEMETAAREGKASDDRWQLRKDGSRFWASGVMEALRDADGRLLCYVKVLRDNTEQKVAEDAQRKLNESLEEIVADRTRQLVAREEQVRDLAARLTLAEHEERNRIAQILHDDLQQLLYSVQLKVGFIRGAVESGKSEDLIRNATQAEQWVAEAVKTAQQLAVDLSPQVLEKEGLTEALGWLAGQMEELYGLKIRLEAEKGLQLPRPTRILMFQSVRELLFNVVKHAGVLEATIELVLDGEFLVRVIDRGKGFDVKSLEKHSGFGVLSVRHRIDLIGGSMDIASQPGKGTTVTIRTPVESNRN